MDIFTKAYEYTVARDGIESGIYPYFYANSSKTSSVATLNGRQVLMFGSCNYLGLANHPDVRLASQQATDHYGTCSAGCRLQSGNLDVHIELESKFAAYLRREACLAFTSGYQASVGAISALTRRRDVVILDRAAHASCVDGARLSHGTIARFRHNDLDHLESLLKEYCQGDGGVLVVVDGVYSITGELAPLRELAALKQRYGFRLLVDDAHGTGVMGSQGRGTAEHLGVEDEVDLVVGSFGKAYASTGGFVAGARAVVDFIRHTATPLIHSTSMTPGDAAAAAAALDVSIREPQRRASAVDLAQRFRDELRATSDVASYLVPSPSALVSIVVGDELTMLCYWQRLYGEGLYANPVLNPAVPVGKATIRISCTADHTDEDLVRALAAVRQAGSPADAVRSFGLDEARATSLARQLSSASARS
jgi:8-amino-7-oxononanoate synthase